MITAGRWSKIKDEVKKMNEDYLMISFENTHSAIQTERLLGQHFKVVTMPTLREIRPGHFVQCNDAEFEAYKKELGI